MKRLFYAVIVMSVIVESCGNANYSTNNNNNAAILAKAATVQCINSVKLTAWNALTQQSRDNKLLSVTAYYVGQQLGQCKPFVTFACSTASGVTVPTTQGNNIYWNSLDPCGNPCLGVNVANKGAVSIRSCGSMDIIQMYWRPRLAGGGYGNAEAHTAFVIKYVAHSPVDSTQWIDCNYVANTVAIHSVACDSFIKWTGPNSGASGTGYNVYHLHL